MRKMRNGNFAARRGGRAAWLALAAALFLLLPARGTPPACGENDLPELITPKADAAIEKGLAYLARSQSRDGSWSGNSGGRYPCTMTALAGLALLAAGNTPAEGEYSRNIRLATDYLLGKSNRTGLIASAAEEARPMYGHGFSMLFLAQVYGMETSPERQKKIHAVLERAVQLTAVSQSKDGGWIYTPDGGSDEGSVTVTQIQGLRACRNAGIKVPKRVIDKACEYIHKCALDNGGICYSLSSRGQAMPSITAAAVSTMYNAGQYENPVALKALGFVKKLIQDKKGDAWNAFQGHRYYSLLYASQAMWFSSEEDWKNFFPGVRDNLIKSQEADGSWNGDYVGQIYGTSIALLILQLPKKYLPILQR